MRNNSRRQINILLSVIVLILILSFEGWAGDPVGVWNFDDPHDLTRADVGNDLVLVGFHQPAVGIDSSDVAARIGIGSYYICAHDIPANGGGNKVNEWSLVMDIRYPESETGSRRTSYL